MIKIFLDKDVNIETERKKREMQSENNMERKNSVDFQSTKKRENSVFVESSKVKSHNNNNENTSSNNNDNNNNNSNNNNNNNNSNSRSNSFNSNNNNNTNMTITDPIISYIFDSEMIRLIMEDLIGMTSHGMTSSSSSGTGLERTLSQEVEGKVENVPGMDTVKDSQKDNEKEKEKDKDKDKEAEEVVKAINDAERIGGGGVGGGGDDLDKNGKLGGDKDGGTAGQSDASSLKIELLKVGSCNHFI